MMEVVDSPRPTDGTPDVFHGCYFVLVYDSEHSVVDLVGVADDVGLDSPFDFCLRPKHLLLVGEEVRH